MLQFAYEVFEVACIVVLLLAWSTILYFACLAWLAPETLHGMVIKSERRHSTETYPTGVCSLKSVLKQMRWSRARRARRESHVGRLATSDSA
jgi:hypothetical protein